MAYVRAYEDGDAARLAPRLRQADIQEIQASRGVPALQCLEEAAELSAPSCSIIHEAQVIGLFGVVPYYTFGRIWLLGSDDLVHNKQVRTQFLQQSAHYIDQLLKHYPTLCNEIDERNTAHINWLRRMGFTFIRRIPHFGVEDRPFMEFIKCATQFP